MNAYPYNPTAAPRLLRPVVYAGNLAVYLLLDLGRMGGFLAGALAGIFRSPFRYRELIKQLQFIGTGSVAVIFFYRPVVRHGPGAAGVLLSA